MNKIIRESIKRTMLIEVLSQSSFLIPLPISENMSVCGMKPMKDARKKGSAFTELTPATRLVRKLFPTGIRRIIRDMENEFSESRFSYLLIFPESMDSNNSRPRNLAK